MSHSKNPISLAIGTEVTLTKYASPTWQHWTKDDDALVITAADISGGCIQYSVNGCSWFDPRDLKFIAEPTEQSVAYAIQLCANQDDDEDEDEGAEEPDVIPEPEPVIELKRHPDAVKAMKDLVLEGDGDEDDYNFDDPA